MPFDGTHLEEWQITLLKAAETIRRQGLCQHDYGTPEGPVCIYGALNLAVGLPMNSVMDDVTAEAANHLCDRIGLVSCWNDKPGRTAEEVARVMESVATQGRE